MGRHRFSTEVVDDFAEGQHFAFAFSSRTRRFVFGLHFIFCMSNRNIQTNNPYLIEFVCACACVNVFMSVCERVCVCVCVCVCVRARTRA